MDKKFFIAKDVADAGVKIVYAVMEGIDNTKESEAFVEYRSERLHELYREYENLDVHEDPVLEGYNVLHDRTGVKRRKNIPASENLVKLLKKGQGDLFTINLAVDIYNLVSLETKLALGAHDMDRTEGNVTLRFTDGSENFQPLGQAEPVHPAVHEYSYCDDANDVLCRLEIRQVQKTAVTEETKNIWYIIQGNDATSDEQLVSCAERIIAFTDQYCGGKGRVVLPEVF